MASLRPTERLTTSEAISAAYDDALMVAAELAYRHGETHRKDQEAANMIGDAIRALMKAQA